MKVVHGAFRYDLSPGKFSLYPARLARLSGESVLDVGWGTGTLAIAAKRRVGPAGRVYGIDASPEVIARARKKAKMAGVEVTFENAVVEKMPFTDGTFDAVLATVMLHHLGRKARQQCACEMRRVLKPGGRVLAVDFGGAAHEGRSLLARFHRHGHVKLPDLIALLDEAGLKSVVSHAVGISDLQFVLAAAPSGA